MSFTLLPAIDVADGRVVRAGGGPAGSASASDDPLELALTWQAEGAPWIHLVDLDAALGRGSNGQLVASVIGVLDVDVELSAGVSNDEALEWAVSTGSRRIILGTAALLDRAWCERVIASHGERIAVGLDVRIVDRSDGSIEHRLSARGGRVGDSSSDLWETLAWLDRVGCARYVVTDVDGDGMLDGPNVELCRAVARATTSPVIASGGIAGIDDLIALAQTDTAGGTLEGSIVGKALHVGRFTLVEALEAVRAFPDDCVSR